MDLEGAIFYKCTKELGGWTEGSKLRDGIGMWVCTCYTILTVAAGMSNLKHAEGIRNANVYTNRLIIATTLKLIVLFPMTKLNSNE